MTSQAVQDLYAEAEAILLRCEHPNRGCEIDMGKGERLWVCVECWNSHVTHRRHARRLEVAEHNAAQPQCDRCGKRPVRWHYGQFHLCGYCKQAVQKEHHRNLAATGNAAVAGLIAGGLAVKTTGWACKKERPPQLEGVQEAHRD